MPLIEATQIKEGNNIIIEGHPCVVKSIDISKTGKHGSAKVRLEAVGIIDGKKRIMVKPGHERFEIPIIDKRKAQIISINEKASIMDLESFETIEAEIDPELKEKLKEGIQVEYWNIEGKCMIKRIL